GGGRFRGAVVLDLDDARLDARKAREAFLEPGQGAVRLRAAVTGFLALRAVDDDRYDGRELFAIFPGQQRIGERQEQRGKRQCPQRGAADTPPEAEGRENYCDDGKSGEHEPWQEGRKFDGHGDVPLWRRDVVVVVRLPLIRLPPPS